MERSREAESQPQSDLIPPLSDIPSSLEPPSGDARSETCFPLWDLAQFQISTGLETITIPRDTKADFRLSGGRDELQVDRVAVHITKWRATAACQIDLLEGGPPQPIDLERQLRLIAHLLALPDHLDWAVQMRLVAVPGSSAGRDDIEGSRDRGEIDTAYLELHLILSASRPTVEIAESHLHDLLATLDAARSLLAPRYALVPVTGLESLTDVFHPFPLQDMVEVRRQMSEVETPEGPAAIPLALPLRSSTSQLLCQALLGTSSRLGRPFAWMVTIEGAADRAVVQMLLQDMLAHAHLEHKNLLETGQRQGSMIGVIDHGRNIEQAGRAMEQQIWGLSGLVGRVQTFLASGEGEVPSSLTATAVAELSNAGEVLEGGSVLPPVGTRVGRPREQK